MSALYVVIGVVMYASLVAVAAGGPLLRLWRWARRTDTYEPQAAEAPAQGCDDCGDEAWRDVQRVFAGQFDADGDLLAEGGTAPPVAAASDSRLLGEIYEAIDRYRLGEPIERDAPREA